MAADLNRPSGVSEATKQPFVANLITPGRALIFAAGFLLALLLGRMLPSVALFHPAGQIHTKDVVITLLNGQTLAEVKGFATEGGESFSAPTEAWDGDLLNSALGQAQGGPIAIPARVTYVVPDEGIFATIRVEARE